MWRAVSEEGIGYLMGRIIREWALEGRHKIGLYSGRWKPPEDFKEGSDIMWLTFWKITAVAGLAISHGARNVHRKT